MLVRHVRAPRSRSARSRSRSSSRSSSSPPAAWSTSLSPARSPATCSATRPPVLDRHRRLSVRDGGRLLAVPLLRARAARPFLRIEMLIGLIGGLAAAAVRAASASTPSFRFALYALVLAIGILVGLEIPLVMRILKRYAGGSAQRRPEDARLAGAHLRLPRRPGRLDRVPAAAGAAARPDPHRRLLRADERRRPRPGRSGSFAASCAGSRAQAVACAATTAALASPLSLFADRVTTWAEDRFYADHVTSSGFSYPQAIDPEVQVSMSWSSCELLSKGKLTETCLHKITDTLFGGRRAGGSGAQRQAADRADAEQARRFARGPRQAGNLAGGQWTSATPM